MDFSQILNIQMLPIEISKSLLNDKNFHLPYNTENMIYECVKHGDLKKLFSVVKSLDNISVGQMSSNNINQYKYMAISCMTLATRYAIEGGVDEEQAYNFSDLFIQQIDSANSQLKILKLITEGVIKLTNTVNEENKKIKKTIYIRKCISYINKNINKRITVKELANHCGISEDYLSHHFKQEMGQNISEYIMNLKLETAKTMILDNIDNSTICYSLGFSSQSHFITAFKKKFNMTPKEFEVLNS